MLILEKTKQLHFFYFFFNNNDKFIGLIGGKSITLNINMSLFIHI